MAENHKDEQQLPEELQDWIITEQIFKDSGLEFDEATVEHNDFLRNLNAVGSFLSSISSPTVQFAQINDGQILLAFDDDEPVDLSSPFFPVDDEGQLWALHHREVENLTSYSLESPQISALTAYGYNQADKMMLFNLQEQRILSINAADEFSQAMVRALAVEHAMEPWNGHRTIYLIGFDSFGDALKHNLAPYHSNIVLLDSLNELTRDAQHLNNATIFSIGQTAQEVSEFIRTTTEFNLGVVCDVPIGGGFIYYQETEDRGALEPGNVTIYPFLMPKDSEDYQAVEANYAKHLDEAHQDASPLAPVLQEQQSASAVPAAQEEAESLPEASEPEDFTITDEDLQKLLETPAVAEELPEPIAEAEPEPAQAPVATEAEEPEDAPVLEEELPAPSAYLKLMGPTPELISENGSIGGFPAEVIAYTYLQQTYGDTPPTFADLCNRLWGESPTGSNKSKFSARRKRAKEKLSELIPSAEFITERDGWKINNLTTDIDHIPSIKPSEPLTKTSWASTYLPALTEKIHQATKDQ